MTMTQVTFKQPVRIRFEGSMRRVLCVLCSSVMLDKHPLDPSIPLRLGVRLEVRQVYFHADDGGAEPPDGGMLPSDWLGVIDTSPENILATAQEG